MQLVTKGNDFLWSFLLIILLCGTGTLLHDPLKIHPGQKVREGVRQVFGHFSMNGEKHEKGEMTPFQSIATAIAAQVGTGNLAGAATALIGGGLVRSSGWGQRIPRNGDDLCGGSSGTDI